ncbi:HSP20-like chaperone, partial [Anaeromyces robustus]
KKQENVLFDKDVYKLVDFCPYVDLGEDENNFYIQIDLPGMTKEQINMELSEDRTLTISGERRNNYKTENGMKISKLDCQYGKFSRSFNIPETVNLDGIQAKMENGVLEVTIPKEEPLKNKRRTIQIQ